MAVAGGLGSQLGLKAQVDYDTEIVVDRFFEFNSEGIVPDNGRVYSMGLGRGLTARADRVKAFTRGYAGPINFDVMNKNFGLIFQHMLGENTVSGAGAAKTHTCVVDAAAKVGKYQTVQLVRPGTDNTDRMFTYTGGKIPSWELGCEVDQILKLTADYDFKSGDVNTSKASASYVSTQEPFIFAEGALTVGGSALPTKSFTLRGDSKLATDRRFIGGTKKEPLANDHTDITGSLSGEFVDLTYYSSALAGTQAAMVITFTLATVIPTTATPFSLTITLPAVEFLEAKPTVGGPGLIMLELPFKALNNGTDPIITLAYVTSDTAA